MNRVGSAAAFQFLAGLGACKITQPFLTSPRSCFSIRWDRGQIASRMHVVLESLCIRCRAWGVCTPLLPHGLAHSESVDSPTSEGARRARSPRLFRFATGAIRGAHDYPNDSFSRIGFGHVPTHKNARASWGLTVWSYPLSTPLLCRRRGCSPGACQCSFRHAPDWRATGAQPHG